MNVDLDVIDEPLVGCQVFFRWWRELGVEGDITAYIFGLKVRLLFRRRQLVSLSSVGLVVCNKDAVRLIQ